MNNTKFFYEVTPDIILKAVEELGLPCSGKIVPLNSLENRVYSVELDLDRTSLKSRYDTYRVIKFYRPGRWSKNQILEEHRFIDDLKKEELPVVAPLAFPDGKTLHSIQNFDSNGTELFYTTFPRVGGRIIDEHNEDQIKLLGRLIARIHQVGRTKKAEHRTTLTPTTFGKENCNFLLENKIIPHEIETRYSDLVKTICEISEPWFEVVPKQRIHGDCHLGNILWVENLCKVVDFDDFVMGPAIQDLWLIVPGRDSWNLEQREKLIKAYNELIEFDFETIRLIEPLRALRLIHFSAWIAKRWEDPAFKNVFSHFGSPQYWREELIALEEVLQMMQCGEVL